MHGVREELVEADKNLHKNSKNYSVEVGLRQRYIMPPRLFNSYTDEIDKKLTMGGSGER